MERRKTSRLEGPGKFVVSLQQGKKHRRLCRGRSGFYEGVIHASQAARNISGELARDRARRQRRGGLELYSVRPCPLRGVRSYADGSPLRREQVELRPLEPHGALSEMPPLRASEGRSARSFDLQAVNVGAPLRRGVLRFGAGYAEPHDVRSRRLAEDVRTGSGEELARVGSESNRQ